MRVHPRDPGIPSKVAPSIIRQKRKWGGAAPEYDIMSDDDENVEGREEFAVLLGAEMQEFIVGSVARAMRGNPDGDPYALSFIFADEWYERSNSMSDDDFYDWRTTRFLGRDIPTLRPHADRASLMRRRRFFVDQYYYLAVGNRPDDYDPEDIRDEADDVFLALMLMIESSDDGYWRPRNFYGSEREGGALGPKRGTAKTIKPMPVLRIPTRIALRMSPSVSRAVRLLI